MDKAITPAIFVGHGSPMSASKGNFYGQKWRDFGGKLMKPKAILVISAHWNIEETAVSDLKKPKQIYDFYGFPSQLYDLKYEALGFPELAQQVKKLLASVVEVKINNEWGIDHGAWIPLASFFPQADVPVVQLSIDRTKPASFHYVIAKLLRPLREQGVMIMGSGDIVHNLGDMDYEESAKAFSWAEKFEEKVLLLMDAHKHDDLIDYFGLGPDAALAIPTPEHYLPLLYVLALQEENERIEYFVKGIAHGSVSMTSFALV